MKTHKHTLTVNRPPPTPTKKSPTLFGNLPPQKTEQFSQTRKKLQAKHPKTRKILPINMQKIASSPPKNPKLAKNCKKPLDKPPRRPLYISQPAALNGCEAKNNTNPNRETNTMHPFNTQSGEPYNPPAARAIQSAHRRTMRDRVTAWCLAPAGLPMRLLLSASLLACFALACTM